MSKLPYFPFYPGDWLSSSEVCCMTPAQRGAYINLLCHAWQSDDCGLPDDPDRLAVLSGLNNEWNTCSTFVQRTFVKKGERLFNVRLLQERKKSEEKAKKCKQAGIESGKSRRNKGLTNEQTLNERSTDVEQTLNYSDSDSELNINNKIQKEKHPDLLPGIKPELTPERVVEVWNKMAVTCNSPQVKFLSTKRRKEIQKILKLEIFKESWIEALHIVKNSDWLQGKLSSWKANFDWFIVEKNFIKIIENTYKNQVSQDEPDTCHLTHEEIQAALAMAAKQRAAAVAAGLCDENGELIIPEYEELKKFKAELELHRAEN